MANLLGERWRTTDPRTRLVVVKLWDGRCGHCNGNLIRSEEFNALNLEIDHFIPRSKRGPDSPLNYVASCWECNNSRRDKPIINPDVISKMAKVQSFVSSPDFDEFVEDSIQIDTKIKDSALIVANRCFDHGWHIEGSPVAIECYEECRINIEGRYQNNEWWSRFGSYSRQVEMMVREYLHISGLGKSDEWGNWQGLGIDFPRYCSSPFEAFETIVEYLHRGKDYLTPAIPWFLYCQLDLSDTNRARAHSKSHSRSVEYEANFWKRQNFPVPRTLLRIWDDNGWPTHLFWDYRGAILQIKKEGILKHARSLRAISDTAWPTQVSAVEDYLKEIEAGLK